MYSQNEFVRSNSGATCEKNETGRGRLACEEVFVRATVAVDGRGVQLHNLIAHGLHKMALIC